MNPSKDSQQFKLDLKTTSSTSTPQGKPDLSSRLPTSPPVSVPTPNHVIAGVLKTFISNSSAAPSAPSLLRGNSASSSSSSNAVPVASTSSQALFEALTDAQKEHSLKINPQTVDTVTFPQVASNGKSKSTSQRVVGGSFADSLWRLEKLSGDDSYRMRERDEVGSPNSYSFFFPRMISFYPSLSPGDL